jgi:simple sugar transport system ATP-binding protein
VAAKTLSGGNLQKLLLARALARDPVVLVVHQPTRGLDIAATEEVHARLLALRDRGVAILLISDDLDEVLALSDRVAVIYEGRLMGIVPADEVRLEEIGLMMAGVGGRAGARR